MFQFSKVANLILENTNRAYTREDFMNLLCDRAYQGTGGQKQPSLSNFNKWVNGAEERHGFKVLTEYYSDPRSIEELSEDIQVLLLDALTDLSGLMQRLYTLLDVEVLGGYLSASKREELTCGTEADHLAKMLLFASGENRHIASAANRQSESIENDQHPRLTLVISYGFFRSV